MDGPGLLKLLSDSTSTLSSLYSELGHPPQRLEEAIAALQETLQTAVKTQLDRVQKEVDDAKYTLEHGQKRIERMKLALGENEASSAKGAGQGRRSSRTRTANTNDREVSRRRGSNKLPSHRQV